MADLLKVVVAVAALTTCVPWWPTGGLWAKAIPAVETRERAFGNYGHGR